MVPNRRAGIRSHSDYHRNPTTDHQQIVHFAKVNWVGFTQQLEGFQVDLPLPTNVYLRERILRRYTEKAANIHIPAACIKQNRPNLPAEAAPPDPNIGVR